MWSWRQLKKTRTQVDHLHYPSRYVVIIDVRLVAKQSLLSSKSGPTWKEKTKVECRILQPQTFHPQVSTSSFNPKFHPQVSTPSFDPKFQPVLVSTPSFNNFLTITSYYSTFQYRFYNFSMICLCINLPKNGK